MKITTINEAEGLLEKYLNDIRVPNNNDKIYKDECVYSFDTPYSPDGLYVCMKTFYGVGKDFIDLHHKKTGSCLYLHFQKIKREKTPEDISEEIHPKKITKLGIGIEGGLNDNTYKDEYDENISFTIYPGFTEICLPDENMLPLKLTIAKKAIIEFDSAAKVEELQSISGTWDGEKRDVTKHAETLIQLNNDKKVPCSGWKCEKCDLKDNLWLNLTDGSILCSRRNFDGSGGNNHALDHYNETKYPLVVKLGTVTINCYNLNDITGDVFSFDEDEMVTDPYLDKHLAHFGINGRDMKITMPSMAELEFDYNLKVDEIFKLSNNNDLQTITGPEYTGIVNLGNSCYLSSIVQVLFSIPDIQKFYNRPHEIFTKLNGDPTQNFNTQMAKLAYGLLSGKYSKLDQCHQQGIKPTMFKNLIGKGHPEFSSKRQQDAQEFYLHLINLIERNFQTASNGNNDEIEDPVNSLKFQIEERIQCMQSEKVTYRTRTEFLIPLPIPLDKAINKEEIERQENDATLNTDTDKTNEIKADEKLRPIVTLDSCFEAFINPEVVDDYFSTAINAKTTAMKSTKLKTFPNYLMIQLKKFALDDNWVAKKLNVSIDVPDEIDLKHLRGKGLQVNEVEMPEFKTKEPEMNIDYNVLNQLMEMGFSINACKRALLNTDNNGTEVALNWLFEHQSDADFNSPLNECNEAINVQDTFIPDTNALQMLQSMGLSEEHAKRGLKETGNNVERAIDWIFCHQEELNNPQTSSTNADVIMDSLSSAYPSPKFQDGNEKYRLVAFISHIGTSTICGHYVCHIYKNGKWILYNDDKIAVTENPPKDLGYLYLYKRV